MKRVIAFGLAVLVNALFIGVFASQSPAVPEGKVFVTDLANDTQFVVSR